MGMSGKNLYHVVTNSQLLRQRPGLFCFADDSEQATQYFVESYVTRELEEHRDYYLHRISDSDGTFVELFYKVDKNGPLLLEEEIREWFDREDWAELFIKYHRGEDIQFPDEMIRYIARKDIMEAEIVFADQVDFVEV